MARPIKTGLDYFPLDVDIFEDPKLLFVEDRFDVKGEIVTIKLLCWIYRNGYFCEWNDEHALIFAKKNFSSIKASLCIDVVNELLKRGFFNKDIFETFGVLTSAAIQERWKKVVDLSKRKARLNPELNLLTQEETKPEKELTTSETDESTQSKVKESKVKESKGEKGALAIDFLRLYVPTELEVFEMQNKKQIQDYDDFLGSFNDTMEIEIVQGKIEFSANQLMPRLRKYARSWIRNQKPVKVLNQPKPIENPDNEKVVKFKINQEQTIREMVESRFKRYRANMEQGGYKFKIIA